MEGLVMLHAQGAEESPHATSAIIDAALNSQRLSMICLQYQ